jgi:hypothetical protein
MNNLNTMLEDLDKSLAKATWMEGFSSEADSVPTTARNQQNQRRAWIQ